MPLKKGTGRKTMSKNIETEMHEYERSGSIGNAHPANKKKAQKQAIAIAYSKARESGAKLPKKGKKSASARRASSSERSGGRSASHKARRAS